MMTNGGWEGNKKGGHTWERVWVDACKVETNAQRLGRARDMIGLGVAMMSRGGGWFWNRDIGNILKGRLL